MERLDFTPGIPAHDVVRALWPTQPHGDAHVPPGLAYALLPDLKPFTKPAGFASLQALARRIHRDRGHDALQLTRAEIVVRGRPRDVVKVLAYEPASSRSKLIGYAWINGRPLEVLQLALEALRPSAGAYESAA